jgi:Flp pilus assembly protein TadD
MTTLVTLEALLERGIAEHRAGRLEQAEAALHEIIEARPDHAEALHSLGLIAHQRGRNQLAIAYLDRAVSLNREEARYHCNLGVVLGHLGRLAEAEQSLRRALEPRPDYPAALANLGQILNELGRPAEGEAHLRDALRLRPAYPEALNNLGISLSDLGRTSEAETVLRQALSLLPEAPNALNNLGTALCDLGRYDEAEASFREAIRLKPDFADARNNLSYLLLLTGRFEEGWTEYEWRWGVKHMAPGVRDFAVPRWNGEAIGGRTILLHAEQGLGDTLQFCRYAALIEPSAKVVLEVQAPLVKLLARLPGVAQVVAPGAAVAPFDLHCPLLSLPRVLGATLATIPAAMPYLSAAPEAAAAWRERLAGLPGLKVGLVWAGESRTGVGRPSAIDARRSMALSALAQLAELARVSFVSLQKGKPAAQAADPPPGMSLTDFTADLSDFADTAALIDNLDLVISVDTSVAHLAGGMGKPVWLLNRYDTCWRWLLERDDSPWYPTLRQFRQPSPGDWQTVVAAVRDALHRLAAGDLDQLKPSAPSPTPASERPASPSRP